MSKIDRKSARLLGLIISALLIVGAVSYTYGISTATTNYYLDTPFAGFDYFVGKYSNSSYYVVNASTWDNFDVDTNFSHIANQVTSIVGSKVLLGSLSATLDSSIVLTTNVSLRGAGVGKTVLRLGNAINKNVIECAVSATPRFGIEVADLEIDGNQANQGAGQYHGVYLPDCYGFKVHDLYVFDVKSYGVYTLAMSSAAASVGYGLITDCIFRNIGANAVTVGGSGGHSQNVVVSSCSVYVCGDVGISLFADNCQVVACSVWGANDDVYAGESVEGWGYGIEAGNGNLVSGCTAFDSDYGFAISDANNSITDSSANNCSDSVAFLAGHMNVVSGFNSVNASVAGVYVAAGNYSSILNVVNHGGYAVFINAGVHGTFINGCDFRNSSSVSDGGTSTIFGYSRGCDGVYDTSP